MPGAGDIPFDREVFKIHYELQDHLLHAHVPVANRAIGAAFLRTADRTAEWAAPAAALRGFFADLRAHHAFASPPLDWGFRLPEPMCTKALARMLDAGGGPERSARIRAFLRALGATDVPDRSDLQYLVAAEEDRIDLEIWYREPGSDWQIVLVEAKFRHRITPGQLKRYTGLRDKPNDGQRVVRRVILGLDPTARQGLKGRQFSTWGFVSWRDLLLRFERLRPVENDPSQAMLLHTLWRRIGALDPETVT